MPPRGNSSYRGSMRARPGTARIAGIDIPIEESLLETAAGSSSLVPAAEPGQLYPARAPEALRPPARLSKDERAQISGYKGVRDRIWDGPLFTVLGGVEGGKVGRARKEEIGGVVILDPFENGVETYSAKYVVGKRRLPRLEGGRCVLKFFPRELWGVLDSKYSTASMNELARRKKVKLDERKKLSKLDAVATAEDGDEKGSDVDDVVEDGDEEGGAKSDHDDEFEEDEDDMVGDYNAEQYFDDGGDDAGDDYDGGDGGGDDGMY